MSFRSLRVAWAMAAVAIGWFLGSAIDKLPVGAIARGIIAMAVAWNVTLVVVSLSWLFVSPFASTNVTPIPFRTVAIASAGAAVLATGLHYAAAYVSQVDARFMDHETISLGVFGALAGMVHGMVSRGSEEFE